MAVSNAQILQSLQSLGLLAGPVSVAGKQHGEFKTRLINMLRPTLGDQAEEFFSRAENMAGWSPDPKKDIQTNLANALKVRGVPENQLEDIDSEAYRLAGQGNFNDEQWFQAAANILGASSPQLTTAFTQTGVNYQPTQFTKPQAPGQEVPATPALFTPPPAPVGAPGVAPSTREQVMQTQRDLNAKGAKLKVDGIMGPQTQAAINKYGGAPGTAGPSKDQPPPPMDDAAAEQKLKEQYGYTSWAWGIPELKQILLNVAKNPSGFTPDAITGQLEQTQWWKQNGGAVAQYLEKQANDPVSFARIIQSAKDNIGVYAQKFGITIATDRLDQLANDATKFAWDDQTLHDAIANEFHYQPGGADSAFVSGLKQDARGKWLVPMTDDAIQTWGHDIASGRKSKVDYDTYMGQMAKGMWPGLSGWIDQGGDVATFVAPYKKIIGDTLEINPDTIDFTDSKYIGVLNQVDKKTGTRTAMSPAETMTWARQQPEWAKTQNAHQTVAGLTQKLAETMGMA